MPIQWKPQPIEVYESWVESLIKEASDSLNDWEFEFVTSLHIRLAKCINLTEAQAKKLESSYSEKTK